MRCPLLAAWALAAGICLPACDKQDPAPAPGARNTPAPGAQTGPTPTPKDELDAGSNRLKAKAEGAITAVENYLARQNPKFRSKVAKAAEKFSRDKDQWRGKLRQEQKELQPEIDRLQEQLGKVDTPETRERLHQQIANLQGRSQEAERKLAELETAGQDGWRAFKARVAADLPSSPTPSARPGGSRAEETPTPPPKQDR